VIILVAVDLAVVVRADFDYRLRFNEHLRHVVGSSSRHAAFEIRDSDQCRLRVL
jgi:hypothetical protein